MRQTPAPKTDPSGTLARQPGWRLAARGVAIGAARALWPTDSPRRLSILIFHRVLPSPDPWFCSDPDATQFEEAMRTLREHFAPVGLYEGLERLRLGDLPPGAVSVTFDDGYADNLTVAAPILRRWQIPATVFVASGYLDGGIMWNDRVSEAVRRCRDDLIDLTDQGLGQHEVGAPQSRPALVDRLLQEIKYRRPEEREEIAGALARRYAPDMVSPMMTGAQLRELQAQGFEIGGHTVSHPILASTDERTAYEEIGKNKEALEDLIGEPLRLFAYPNGKPGRDFGPAHASMVQKLGYKAAVTTSPGVATQSTDPYGLPRYTPWERNPTRFAVRLLLNRRALV